MEAAGFDLRLRLSVRLSAHAEGEAGEAGGVGSKQVIVIKTKMSPTHRTHTLGFYFSRPMLLLKL